MWLRERWGGLSRTARRENVESDVEWEGVLVCLSSTDDEWGRGARKRGSPHAPRLRGACVRCRPHAVHGVQVPLHGGLSSCTCCHRRLTHGRWWPALAVAGPLHAHHVERRATCCNSGSWCGRHLGVWSYAHRQLACILVAMQWHAALDLRTSTWRLKTL